MPGIIKPIFAFALMGGLLAGAKLVDAHHAMVMYDSSKTLVLEGTVVELRWTNPHVFVRVSGRIEDGPMLEWVLETSSPGNLVRLGNWSETALKPGDKIKVELNPHRETDRREARLYKLTLTETGQVFGTAYRGG
jgi:Family of unknown function (DUF6152)